MYVFKHSERAFSTSRIILKTYRVGTPFVGTSNVQSVILKYEAPRIGWYAAKTGFSQTDIKDSTGPKNLVWARLEITNKKNCLPQALGNWEMCFCLQNCSEPQTRFAGHDTSAPVFYKNQMIGIASQIERKYSYNAVPRPTNRFKSWTVLNTARNGALCKVNAISLSGSKSRVSLIPNILFDFFIFFNIANNFAKLINVNK